MHAQGCKVPLKMKCAALGTVVWRCLSRVHCTLWLPSCYALPGPEYQLDCGRINSSINTFHSACRAVRTTVLAEEGDSDTMSLASLPLFGFLFPCHSTLPKRSPKCWTYLRCMSRRHTTVQQHWHVNLLSGICVFVCFLPAQGAFECFCEGWGTSEIPPPPPSSHKESTSPLFIFPPRIWPPRGTGLYPSIGVPEIFFAFCG